VLRYNLRILRRVYCATPHNCRRTHYAIPLFIKCPRLWYLLRWHRNSNSGHSSVDAAAGGVLRKRTEFFYYLRHVVLSSPRPEKKYIAATTNPPLRILPDGRYFYWRVSLAALCLGCSLFSSGTELFHPMAHSACIKNAGQTRVSWSLLSNIEYSWKREQKGPALAQPLYLHIAYLGGFKKGGG
jgi:hypothetical protein